MSIGNIFRSYDIRGVYKRDLDENIIEGVGNVLSQVVGSDVLVAMDMRTSSQRLRKALIRGITANKKTFDAGLVPMGAAMFYAWKNKLALAYVTASHLPKEWNGVKFFHPDGIGFIEQENFRIRDMFLVEKFIEKRKGRVSTVDNKKVINAYKTYLLSKIKLNKKLRIVIDCGNGMAGLLAPQLFRELGCEVFTLFDNLDGNFPNRDPEPTSKAVNKLRETVKKKGADLGIAYDGDADRMLIVDDKSRVIAPEQVAYLILSELLIKVKGPIVANVECTKAIDDVALKFKRKVFRIRVGHPYLVKEAQKRKASFGLESAGHFVMPSLVPFDDALAVSLYAVQVISRLNKPLSSLVDEIPVYYFERINFNSPDEEKFGVIDKLKKKLLKDFKRVKTIDGIRVDFERGWALIRASNTGPVIRLTVEGESRTDFEDIKGRFIKLVKAAL